MQIYGAVFFAFLFAGTGECSTFRALTVKAEFRSNGLPKAQLVYWEESEREIPRYGAGDMPIKGDGQEYSIQILNQHGKTVDSAVVTVPTGAGILMDVAQLTGSSEPHTRTVSFHPVKGMLKLRIQAKGKQAFEGVVADLIMQGLDETLSRHSCSDLGIEKSFCESRGKKKLQAPEFFRRLHAATLSCMNLPVDTKQICQHQHSQAELVRAFNF